MSKQERGMVTHNINTYFYRTGFDKRIGESYGIFIANHCYMFYNNGFDDRKVHTKIRIKGNEEMLKKLEKEYVKNGV